LAISAAALSGSALQSDYRFDFEDENQTACGRFFGSAKDGEWVAGQSPDPSVDQRRSAAPDVAAPRQRIV
jgi:hypothetical protein